MEIYDWKRGNPNSPPPYPRQSSDLQASNDTVLGSG